MSDTPIKLRPFEFHGLSLHLESSKQAYADCFLCGGDGKLGLIPSTGQYRCNVCEATGNAFTFISELHKLSLQQTKTKQYNALTKHRYISAEEFVRWKVAQSYLTGDWLIPQYNLDGKLANLMRCRFERDGNDEVFKVFGTPGCKTHLFYSALNKNHKTVVLVEGPWNPMSLEEHLRITGYLPLPKYAEDGEVDGWVKIKRESIQIYGIPGAKNFKEEWSHLLDGKRVILLGDNDWPKKLASGKKIKPGWEGMEKTIRIVQEQGDTPTDLLRIEWGGDKGYTKQYKSGYDVRDCLNEISPSKKKDTSIEAMKTMMELVRPVSLTPSPKKMVVEEDTGEEVKEIEPLECNSFDELCKHFSKALHVHPAFKDTLAVMLATNLSTPINHTEQLWFRILGPPGSGKSTLAECVGAAKAYCKSLDIFTGFNSGFIGSKKASKTDSSLIPSLQGKTLIIKDGDTILTAPNRDRIMAELRAIYDKANRVHYKNRKEVEYEDILMTQLWCGTDDLRQLNKSSLGERFLDCEILGEADPNAYLDRASKNAYMASASGFKTKKSKTNNEAKSKFMEELKGYTYGYLKYLHENRSEIPAPELSSKREAQLKALAQLVATVRAKSSREKDELTHRPRKETPTRVLGQFIKFAVCIAVVLNKTEIDKEVVRIIRKITHDTVRGFTLEVVELLAKHREGLSVKQISTTLGIAETTVRRLIDDMSEFKTVYRVTKSNRSGIGGRHLHLWTLSKEMHKLWDTLT